MKFKNYINDGKVINITSKLKQQEKIERQILIDVVNISNNMRNALLFVNKEAEEGGNLKKIKSMLNKIIKEIQFMRNDIK